MYIDTHCHLTFPQFEADRQDVLTNAKKAGVKRFLVPGTNIGSSKDAIELAIAHADCVSAAVGIHPYEASDGSSVTGLERLLIPEVAAIGECGLDYHLYKGFPATGKKEEQKFLFDAQLRLALKRNLPVIIHCRDAYEDIFSVLDALPAMPAGVFHCFAGGLSDFREVSKRGFYVGFDGNVTYSKQLALIVPHIPVTNILLETDAPYLPPATHRGERSEPKYIPEIAHAVSRLTGTPPDRVAAQTTANARLIFPSILAFPIY